MGYDPVHPDTLAQRLQFPAADVYAELLELEPDGEGGFAGRRTLPTNRNIEIRNRHGRSHCFLIEHFQDFDACPPPEDLGRLLEDAVLTQRKSAIR